MQSPRTSREFEWKRDISTLTPEVFNTELQRLITEKPRIDLLCLYTSFRYPRFPLHQGSIPFLRKIVENNLSLIQLYITHVSLGDSGASALAEGLKSPNKLQVLILIQTNIMEAGGLALANTLKNMRELVSLNLNHNEELGGKACIEIMKACKNIPGLNTLSLLQTGVVPRDAEVMLLLLSENNRIHNFSLNSIYLRDTLRKKIATITAFHAFTHKYVNKELPFIFWALTEITGLTKDVTIPIMHFLRPLSYNHPHNFPIPKPIAKGRDSNEGINLVYQDAIDAAYVHSLVTKWEYCYILHLWKNTIQIIYATDIKNQGIWIKPQQGIVINCYNRDYARQMKHLFFQDCKEAKQGTRKHGKNNLLISKLGLFAPLHVDSTPPYVLDDLQVIEVKRLESKQCGYEITGKQRNDDMHSIIIFDKGSVISGTNFTHILSDPEQQMRANWEDIKQHFGIGSVENVGNNFN